MTNELRDVEFGEKDLPRWIQVPAGLILGLATLLCAFAIILIVFFGPRANKLSPIAILLLLVFLIPCLWVLEKCFRLVTGHKRHGGLLSPTALRIVALGLLLLPIAGFFTAYYRQMGALGVFQAVTYLFGFFGLRALAHKREADEKSKEQQHGTGNRT
jgi:hypothetical protein